MSRPSARHRILRISPSWDRSKGMPASSHRADVFSACSRVLTVSALGARTFSPMDSNLSAISFCMGTCEQVNVKPMPSLTANSHRA